MRVNTRVIILFAILASLLSFAKFSPCQGSVWAGPGQYIHACYSDLPALFSERAFGKGEWAFNGGDQAVEYPVLQGLVMWATAKVSPDGPVGYFNFSSILIALLFIASTVLIHRMKPDNALVYALAPTGILALFRDSASESLNGLGGLTSVTGGSFPARIWTAFMKGALKGQPVLDFPAPANVGGLDPIVMTSGGKQSMKKK